jgi:hypothetical protein
MRQIDIITTDSSSIDRKENLLDVEAILFPNVCDAKERFWIITQICLKDDFAQYVR